MEVESWRAPWEEALAEREEIGEAYNQAKEAPGQVTRAEANRTFRDFKVEGQLLFAKLQGLWGICVPSDRMCRQYVM